MNVIHLDDDESSPLLDSFAANPPAPVGVSRPASTPPAATVAPAPVGVSRSAPAPSAAPTNAEEPPTWFAPESSNAPVQPIGSDTRDLAQAMSSLAAVTREQVQATAEQNQLLEQGGSAVAGGNDGSDVADVIPKLSPLAAVQAIGNKVSQAAQIAGQAIQFGSEVGSSVIGNRPGEAILQVGSAAADLAQKIPVVGTALNGLGKTAVEVMEAFRKVNNAILARADELQNYSGAIGTAQAQADVRSILADIREAQTMGDDYARTISLNSDISQTLRELLLPIKQFLVDKFNSLLEVVRTILEWVQRGINGATAASEAAGEAWDKLTDGRILGAVESLVDAPGRIGKAVAKAIEKPENPNGFVLIDQFLSAGQESRVGIGGSMGDQGRTKGIPPVEQDPRLGVPVFAAAPL